jgi:predicted dehydrogenase
VWKKLEDYTYTNMWGKPTPGGKKDVDDYALALIRFAGGATLQLNVSWALNVENMHPDSGVRLMGNKGGVELKGLDEPRFYGEEAGHIVDVRPQFTPTQPFMEEMRHFVNSIESGKQPMATAQQGRTVQSILDAIYRSGQEGKEVRVS